jgi:hypothetical protein
MRAESGLLEVGLKTLRDHRDAIWYGIATALPPAVALMLGPLVLKKVGLEEFALLGLLGYFTGLISTYSDLGGFSHLVAVFSRNISGRVIEAADVFLLKFLLFGLLGLVLIGAIWMFPRQDALYSLIAVSFLGLPFSQLNTEWYFIARRRYLRLLQSRLLLLGTQVILTLVWLRSDYQSLLFLPAITTISTLIALVFLARHGPRGQILKVIPFFGVASIQRALTMALRLLPIAATALLGPYALAYAMPWFAMATPNRELQGTFSIAYRLVMGFSSLIGPLVFYSMPKMALRAHFPWLRIFGFSLFATAGFWAVGMLVLQAYFAIAGIQGGWLPQARVYFSILLIAVFMACLRTPLVGKLFMMHRYRDYFLLHLCGCLPVVLISLHPGLKVSHTWVPLLACVPDALITAGFMIYFSVGPGRPRSGDTLQETDYPAPLP